MPRVVLGASAYLVVTFPLTAIWHVVVFADTYERIGYIGRDEPSFVLGFLAIAMQGALLSYGYPRFFRSDRGLRSALAYAGITGVFFWTSHVLAAAAKQDLQAQPLFFAIETLYLTLQFGLFGLCLGWLYRPAAAFGQE